MQWKQHGQTFFRIESVTEISLQPNHSHTRVVFIFNEENWDFFIIINFHKKQIVCLSKFSPKYVTVSLIIPSMCPSTCLQTGYKLPPAHFFFSYEDKRVEPVNRLGSYGENKKVNSKKKLKADVYPLSVISVFFHLLIKWQSQTWGKSRLVVDTSLFFKSTPSVSFFAVRLGRSSWTFNVWADWS